MTKVPGIWHWCFNAVLRESSPTSTDNIGWRVAIALLVPRSCTAVSRGRSSEMHGGGMGRRRCADRQQVRGKCLSRPGLAALPRLQKRIIPDSIQMEAIAALSGGAVQTVARTKLAACSSRPDGVGPAGRPQSGRRRRRHGARRGRSCRGPPRPPPARRFQQAHGARCRIEGRARLRGAAGRLHDTARSLAAGRRLGNAPDANFISWVTHEVPSIVRPGDCPSIRRGAPNAPVPNPG
jgi:hypothetical protein